MWDRTVDDEIQVTACVARAAEGVRYVTAHFEGNLDPDSPAMREPVEMFLALADRLVSRVFVPLA